jgi:hypothetical protein
MLRVLVEEQNRPLESIVDEDLRVFDEWFRAQGNDALVGSEKSILKTYLWWKTRGAGNGSQASSGDSVQPVRPEGDAGGEARDDAAARVLGDDSR